MTTAGRVGEDMLTVRLFQGGNLQVRFFGRRSRPMHSRISWQDS